jgi:hypothetical protein
MNRKWKTFPRGTSWASGHDQLGNSFKTFVDRKLCEWRPNERRLAEHRTTNHRLQAKKSCIADARSYRVASHQFKRWRRAVAQ